MCELLIDSKGFSSGSRAPQPLCLRGFARQFARQFHHFTSGSEPGAQELLAKHIGTYDESELWKLLLEISWIRPISEPGPTATTL
jgi:hypothetical protein